MKYLKIFSISMSILPNMLNYIILWGEITSLHILSFKNIECICFLSYCSGEFYSFSTFLTNSKTPIEKCTKCNRLCNRKMSIMMLNNKIFMPKYFTLLLLSVLSSHYWYIKNYRFLYICIINQPAEHPFHYNNFITVFSR